MYDNDDDIYNYDVIDNDVVYLVNCVHAGKKN